MSHFRLKPPSSMCSLYFGVMGTILTAAILLDTQSSFGFKAEMSANHPNASLEDRSQGTQQAIEHRYTELLQRQPIKGGTDGNPKTKKTNKSLWQKLKDLFTRKGKQAGTRSKGLCSITPNRARGVYRSWSDRPLFMWQGSMKSIELHLPGSPPDAEPLWRHQVLDGQTSVIYNGEQPLKRNQEYVYYFQYELEIGQAIHTDISKLYFKVIGEKEYHAIQKDLIAKGLQAPEEESDISEQIILRRSLYFAEKSLFIDAALELYSRSRESPEWRPRIQEMQRSFCRQKTEREAVVSLINRTSMSKNRPKQTIKKTLILNSIL